MSLAHAAAAKPDRMRPRWPQTVSRDAEAELAHLKGGKRARLR